ncbi:MAG: hypothetical protein R2729_17550 [Bryobacteraceae bacterium]
MTGTEMATEESLDAFIQGFEDCSYPASQWTHEAHVVMASAYLTALPLPAAAARIRERIPAYNLAQGGQNTDTSGYHETLTVFWIRIIHAWLADLPPSLSRLERVRAAAARFGQERKLHEGYWSFDVVKSIEARRAWIEPDLKPLASAPAESGTGR